MKSYNYIGKAIEYRMLIVHGGFSSLLKGFILIIILGILPKCEVMAQDIFIDENDASSIPYDEIPVFVRIEGLNSFYLDAIYTNNDLLFVNIVDLFRALGIPCLVGQKGDSLGGFIGNESLTYSINVTSGQLKVGARSFNFKNGLLKEMGIIYMESSLFAETFGISLTFNYRSLTMILKSDFELPIIKQQFIEKLRSNMSKVKGEVFADTIVKRNYHLFKFGMLDWAVASTQTLKGLTDNRFSLGVGAELLFGEVDISLNYSDQYKFDNRQIYYLWRWVDNSKSLIKQAQLGKISNQSISFLNSPIIGAVIRNSPTTVRKATGYYTINEFTEPNWTVELYINNVMVDYTKADPSGLYLFKVPIVYGYTTLKLKFYGPLGEEHTEERTMNIPYTVMPANEFEYGLSAGIVQDSSQSRFGRGEFNYGVNRFVTVGGGLEYLSSIPNGAFIPFAKATIHPFSKLIFNVEYAHGVKTRGLLDYYFKKDILLEIDYTKFIKGQLATRVNSLEERKVKLSVPFRFKSTAGFAKIEYAQFIYGAFNYNQANILASVYYKQFSFNSSSLLNWIDHSTPYITSNLAFSYRFKKGFIIRPSAQYNLSNNSFITYKVVLEKSIPKGYFTVTYERNVLYGDNFISLNFKYDLSFARTNFSVTHSKSNFTFSESAQGSLAFGSGNKYIQGSNNTSVSKGGISLYPFLDLNNNGIFDEDEHMVKLSSVRIMGSKAIYSKKDSIVRVADLNAFTNYIVEFDDNDLENIAWRFKKKRYDVLIDPNQFKRIDIPIISVGEVSGMVYLNNNNNSIKGIGRILVKLYKKNSNKVIAETLSESDGYFNYMGLNPGEYVASIDYEQLKTIKMISTPEVIPVTISESFVGDIVDGLDFTLRVAIEQIKDIDINYPPVEPVIATAKQPANDDKKSPEPVIDETQPVDADSVGVDNPLASAIKQIFDSINNVTPNEPKTNTSGPQAINEENSPELITGNNSWSVVGDFVDDVVSTLKLAKEKVEDLASNFSPIGAASASEPMPVKGEDIPDLNPANESQPIDKDSTVGKDDKPDLAKKQVNEIENNVTPTKPAKATFAAKTSSEKKSSEIINNKETISQFEGDGLQIGAFKIKSNALNIQKELIKRTDKTVSVIYENGLYKVRIQSLSGNEKAGSPIKKVGKPEYFKPDNRNSGNNNSRNKIIDNKPYTVVIQAGAFVKQNNAIGVETKLVQKIDHPVKVQFEDGYYKVRIGGFQNRKQAFAFLPKLFDLKFTNAYIVNLKQP